MLIGASLLEVLTLAHHPSVHAPQVAEAMHQIANYGRLSASVHGLLVVLMLTVFLGFWEFAALRGLNRPAVRAGMGAYGAGTVMMLGAALVSGWVLSAVARAMPQGTPLELAIDAQVLTLCGILNQACANAAVVAMSAGIAAWSLDLLRDQGAARYLGLLGLGVGVLPCLALMSGLLRLDVAGMQQVAALQAVWGVAVGLWLWRSPAMGLSANRFPTRFGA